ncbi:zinc ribbon domain-containing protein [Mycolicibacterium komossense]|uniref:Zinc ribbon domain-containing protein n=1 Tax=Mycolicibacterium komossense TaxID=1779 RepID=A0ABT3C7N6_9MYCO|nr:zinc ribbon domain-containing protein [Mycolicibacterium komossense]MCV7225494.1 zinc ribbon domain-containing protein [Mycolicibacterium komossense]
MSTEDESRDGQDPEVPVTECRVCQVDVPAGEYCGLCGVPLTEHDHDGPTWLRMRAFATSPGENLFLPSIASSLFPHLPQKSRAPFRVALLVVVVALIVFAVLRLPAALVAVAALGLPFLFVLYLHEIDAHRDIPLNVLVLTVVLGIGLGICWVLLTGAMVARSYGVPLGSGIAAYRLLREGLAVPLGSAILALTPAVLVRFTQPCDREALDGFMIGALGALSFGAAATLTRLAPQFTTGMVARARPMEGLLVEAGIRGVAMPLTAAAAGGLIGAALWFKRPPTKADQRPGVVRAVLAFFGVAVLVVYASLGLIDVANMPQLLQLVLHLVVAAVALLALRIGLHLALLHEVHDEIHSDEPILCPHCGHVVPDMAFCPACGAATHASSRSSRALRRNSRPVRTEVDGDHP